MRLRQLISSALLSLVVFVGQARAFPQLRIELKLDPDKLVAGSELDIPVLLVENRAAGDQSLFLGPYSSPMLPATLPGPFPLWFVRTHIKSSQSRLVSFTPISQFETTRDVNASASDISFNLISNNGIPVVVDNTGVAGRTEVEIGTLRVEVGSPVAYDGLAGEDSRVIFGVEIDSADKGAGRKLDAYYQTVGLSPTAIQVLEKLDNPTGGSNPGVSKCTKLGIKSDAKCNVKISAAITKDKKPLLKCVVKVNGKVYKGVRVTSVQTAKKSKLLSALQFGKAKKSDKKGIASFSTKGAKVGNYLACRAGDFQSSAIKLKNSSSKK